MSRRKRKTIPGYPHHVTQRGSRREKVFFYERDKAAYMEMLREYSKQYDVNILAYCLMDNHVHHLAVPATSGGLSKLFAKLHMRYAQMINPRQGWTGHLWQERFYSSPLDEDYLTFTAKYIERNPVEAGMCEYAEEYEWSSARENIGEAPRTTISPDCSWRTIMLGRKSWRQYLRHEPCKQKVNYLLEQTRKDLPCGTEAFVKHLERLIGEQITPNPRGRPRKKK